MKMETSAQAFLLLVALFSHSFYSLATQNSKQLIRETCSKTKHYDACVKSLQSDPRSLASADLNVYTEILVELASSKATTTYSYAFQLSGNKTISDEVLKMCLNDCLVLYDIGINKLKQALVYLDLKEYAEVTKLLGDARDQGQECDGVFKKPPVPKSPSPLTDRNGEFEQLCSIAMEIVNLLG